jgi:hypothetical protein
MIGEKQEIFSEIHRLIEEQREALKGKLTPKVADEYGRRFNQIKDLLDRISRD